MNNINIKKAPKTRALQFQGNKPRRIYKATPEKVWINSEGYINGNYIDARIEVDVSEGLKL